MAMIHPLTNGKAHWLWRYGLAILLFGLTIGLSLLLTRFNLKINLTIPVVFALVATAWHGGRGPGLLISVLFELTTIIFTPIPADSTIPKAIFGYLSVFSLYVFLVMVLTGLQKAKDNLKKQEQQQAAVAAFGKDALASIPLEHLLPKATALTREVLAVDFAAICEMRPSGTELWCSAGDGWNEDVTGLQFSFDSTNSLARQVLESDIAITIDDLSTDPRFETSEILKRHRVRSGACVRISHRNISCGVFVAFHRDLRKFSDDDIHFLRSVANIIAEASGRLAVEDELKKQKSWLQTTLSSIGDGVIATDREGLVRFMNPVAEELTGWKENLACSRPLEEVFRVYNEKTGAEIQNPLQNVLSTGQISGMPHHTILRSKDGTEIPVNDSAAPIKDGDIVKGVVLVFSDVSERRKAEAVSATLASIVKFSSDAIISKDFDGLIKSWNNGAEKLFGYSEDEMIGSPTTILIPDGGIDEEPAMLERSRDVESIEHYETVRRRKDGKLIDISLIVSPVFDNEGNIMGASNIARDITEKKAADRAMRERETMARIVDAQESERHRIAREIHDYLGQKITAHRLRMEVLTHQCSPNSDLGQSIEDLQLSVADIDRGINFLSWELRPTELENNGLVDALQSFVREWSIYNGIKAEFNGTFGELEHNRQRYSTDIETNVYRIVQEALNNVLKHARARSVSVLLQKRADDLNLIIEDDGLGFDPKSNESSPNRVGITSMGDRVALLNGTFEIASILDKGTTVYVRIPLDAKT